MQNDNLKLKIVYAVTIGVIMTVIFITFITIAADFYLPFKNWLKNVFSHHWVGKSILSAAIFAVTSIISFLLPIRANEEKIGRLLKILSWLLVIGTLAIFLFFVYETVK